ncbi:CpsD/CapB family tyrosine-protein kinase [Enterococcus hirae]|uniref:CpsD/CapB family tyrosine-protein kinase n=1 Tax=Enterococcus hirae TaxID=1354 RepID=UPI002E982151|nr:CpsD/CapB family tyrosine-protein kinase [Enterococcus hirae]
MVKRKLGLDIITLSNPKSVASEQYRSIRSNIQIQREKENLTSLMITSASPGEGKTTTSVNLAVVFALTKCKTLLIDGDLRKRSITESLNVPNASGLCGILDKGYSLESSTYSTNVENLDVLPSGIYSENPAEVLASAEFKELLKEISSIYDFVVIDVPPITEVADAKIIATLVDSCALVVRDSKSNKKLIVEAKKTLDTSGANILGVIYNANKTKKSRYYGYGGAYGYGSQKKEKNPFRFRK